MLNTAGYNEFVDNVERVVIETVEKNTPSMVRSIFRQVPWDSTDGEKITFNSVALSGFASRVSENQPIQGVNPAKGNELSKTAIQWADKMEITKRMMKFQNRTPELARLAGKLVGRVNNVIDHEMTQQFFVAGNATTFVGSDGSTINIATSDTKALYATDHVYGGVTFDNTGSLATNGGRLDIFNLTALIQKGQLNTPDDFGTYLQPQYDTIYIADDINMIKKCNELFGSSLTPESNNNAINFYGGTGGFKVVALKHGTTTAGFTKSTATAYRWVIGDSNMVSESLQYQMNGDIEVETKESEEDTLAFKTFVTAFGSYAAVQPQGLMASLSTATPTV